MNKLTKKKAVKKSAPKKKNISLEGSEVSYAMRFPNQDVKDKAEKKAEQKAKELGIKFFSLNSYLISLVMSDLNSISK